MDIRRSNLLQTINLTDKPRKYLDHLRIYLEMIKFEHSIFAMPFALLAMIYAANGWPGWRTFTLIIVAMISARSAAMSFNRLVDHKFDALNVRTAQRALPAGLLKRRQVFLGFIIFCLLFFVSAALLNKLAFVLSPIAMIIILVYSLTKRFTVFSHLFLGLSLGIAPVAAWIAVTGTFSWAPIGWMIAVMFWTAGFDVLYAIQDEKFDQQQGLKSIPAWLGIRKSLLISRIFHFLSVMCLIIAGVDVNGGYVYYFGVMFAAGLLMYEQSLVKEDDISALDMAFFTMNGYVSAGFFVFALIDVATRA
jgi:4-hydroxybenzoate polyprenyltransferase